MAISSEEILPEGIIPGFKKQRRYTTSRDGKHQLTSTWTATDTVYDYDPETQEWSNIKGRMIMPQITSQDEGKLIKAVNGEWVVNPDDSIGFGDEESGIMRISNEGLSFNPPDSETLIGYSQVNILADEFTGKPILEVVDGDADGLLIKHNDIVIEGSNTWDGTNTSLRTAVNSAAETANSAAETAETSATTVTQSNTTTDGKFRVLLSSTVQNTERTALVRKSEYLTFNPNDIQLIVGDSVGSHLTLNDTSITVRNGSVAKSNLLNSVDLTLFGTDNTWAGTFTSLKEVINMLTNNLPNGVYIKDSVTVKVGKNVTLKSLIKPSGSTVEWTIDNQSIASVNNGTITGIAEGTATVTAYITGTQQQSRCVVTVTN